MILLIDNYDSFSYNLYQLIGSVYPDIRVIRNDDCTVEEIEAMQPAALILSPGPGASRRMRASAFRRSGILQESFRSLASASDIRRSARLWRNGYLCKAADAWKAKASIRQTMENRIFAGMSETFLAARYHSLAAKKKTSGAGKSYGRVRGRRSHGSRALGTTRYLDCNFIRNRS